MEKLSMLKVKTNNMRSNSLTVFILISGMVLLAVATGCSNVSAMQAKDTGADCTIESVSEVDLMSFAQESNDAFFADDLEMLFCEKGRFYDDEGNLAVYIISEDITAYFHVDFSTEFSLNDWDVDFPLSEGSEIGAVTYHSGGFEYDWSIFQNRLSDTIYNLRIHSKLESEVDSIVKRNLVIDHVVVGIAEFAGEDLVTFFTNTDVFEKFMDENVEIEIINESCPYLESYEIHLEWLVYQGGCRFDRNVCVEHIYIIWLVDFSSTVRTIWDMITVTNPGCGCSFPK
jgi:hypothetical protein